MAKSKSKDATVKRQGSSPGLPLAAVIAAVVAAVVATVTLSPILLPSSGSNRGDIVTIPEVTYADTQLPLTSLNQVRCCDVERRVASTLTQAELPNH